MLINQTLIILKAINIFHTNLSYIVPEMSIKCRCGEYDLREAGGRPDRPVEGESVLDSGGHGDAMQRLRPPLVVGDAEAWNGRGLVDELPDFLIEGEAPDQVMGPCLNGEAGVAEGEGGGGWSGA